MVKVTKYTHTEIKDYGCMEKDVAMKLVRNYKYDETLDMWFSENAKYSYTIEEV